MGQGERVLMEITNRYKRTGRTVVADNFFTTLNGCETLRRNELSYFGTIRKNKPYIPTEMLPHKSRPVESSLFAWYKNEIALISYVPKKMKAVILMSSEHYTPDVVPEKKNKHQAIIDYNKHKGGVDVMDRMLMNYSTKRKTQRWPLAFFYNILDLAALAAHVIQKEKMDSYGIAYNKSDVRRTFLHELSDCLVKPLMETRSANPQVMKQFNSRTGIACYNGVDLPSMVPVPASAAATASTSRNAFGHTGSCFICSMEKKPQRKTRKSCSKCKKPVCVPHSVDKGCNCYVCENIIAEQTQEK